MFILHTSAKIEQKDCGKEDIWSWTKKSILIISPLPFKKLLRWNLWVWEIDKMKEQFNKYFICFTLLASLLKISQQWYCQLLFWHYFGQPHLQGPRTSRLLPGQKFWMHWCTSMWNPEAQSPQYHFEKPRCGSKQGSDYWTTGQKGIILSPSHYCNY